MEPAEIDFRADGTLYYSIDAGDRWQVMKLVWRVEGDMIVTDQPSAPREERTPFSFDHEGRLVAAFHGQGCWFRKGPKKAPEV
jgi:hypothetical protein